VRKREENEKESWSRPEQEFDVRTLVVVLISFAYTLRRSDYRREPRKPVLFAQQRLIHRGFLSTSTRREKSIYGTYSHTFPSLFPSSIPQSPNIRNLFIFFFFAIKWYFGCLAVTNIFSKYKRKNDWHITHTN